MAFEKGGIDPYSSEDLFQPPPNSLAGGDSSKWFYSLDEETRFSIS